MMIGRLKEKLSARVQILGSIIRSIGGDLNNKYIKDQKVVFTLETRIKTV